MAYTGGRSGEGGGGGGGGEKKKSEDLRMYVKKQRGEELTFKTPDQITNLFWLFMVNENELRLQANCQPTNPEAPPTGSASQHVSCIW